MSKSSLNKGYDIIIRPKDIEVIRLGYNKVEESVLELFKAAGILKQE